MACDTRRGKMCAALVGVTGMTAAEQEQVYATANGQASWQRAANTRTAAQDSLAELHARQMMDIYREAGIAIPTHAKNGIPHRDTHAGHAAMRRTLQCAVCGKFTGLAGCQNCATESVTVSVPQIAPDAEITRMEGVQTTLGNMHAAAVRRGDDDATVTTYTALLERLDTILEAVADGDHGDPRVDNSLYAALQDDAYRFESSLQDDLQSYTDRYQPMGTGATIQDDQDASYAEVESVVRDLALREGYDSVALVRALIPAHTDAGGAYGELDDKSPGGWQRLVVAAAVVHDTEDIPVPKKEAAILYLLERAQEANPHMMVSVRVRNNPRAEHLAIGIRTAYGDVATILTTPEGIARAQAWCATSQYTIGDRTREDINREPIDMIVTEAMQDIPVTYALQYLDQRMTRRDPDAAQPTLSRQAGADMLLDDYGRQQPVRMGVLATHMALRDAQHAAGLDPIQMQAITNKQSPQERFPQYARTRQTLMQLSEVQAQRAADPVCQAEQVYMATRRKYDDGLPATWDTVMPDEQAILSIVAHNYRDPDTRNAQDIHQAATALLAPYYGKWAALYARNFDAQVFHGYTMAVAAEGRYGTAAAQELCQSEAWRWRTFSGEEQDALTEAIYTDLEMTRAMGVGEINARHVRNGSISDAEQAYVATCAGVGVHADRQSDRPSTADLLTMHACAAQWLTTDTMALPLPADASDDERRAVAAVLVRSGHDALRTLEGAMRFLPYPTTGTTVAQTMDRADAKGNEA